MKNWFKQKIAERLNHYKVALNAPDKNLGYTLQSPKKVAVIGAGIAGIASAANLAERGFEVHLFEKAPYIGGKVGSWSFESNGETLRTEHGFHAFFRQYHNLLAFMDKIDARKHLIPIEDYLILYSDRSQQSFKNIDKTPLFNVLSMAQSGVIRYRDMMFNRYGLQLLDLFKFHPQKTFQQYDNTQLSVFMQQCNVPDKMQRVFTSFTRAFFSSPEKMSTAELIKGFHFYFLSNDLGLLYDVLDDDFEHTFLKPASTFIQNYGGKIHLNLAIESLEFHNDKFFIHNQSFDYCILACDVKHLPKLVANSPTLHAYPTFNHQIQSLKSSARYAVLRLWTDKFETGNYPYFIFTDKLKCLDSISFYHLFEKESKQWSVKNNGGIFELHSYALPDDLTDDAVIKKQLLDELFHFLPELKDMVIKHEFWQHRNDFSAFSTGLHSNRPQVQTEVPNLYLAGDWVKMDNTTMLMEAAYTSGAIAANCILSSEKLVENELVSVPSYGLMAKKN